MHSEHFSTRFGFVRGLVLCAVAFALTGVTAWSRDADPLIPTIQSMLDDLQNELGIPDPVHIRIVQHDDALVSVRHSSTDTDSFDLRLESAFIRELNEEELRAVVAHELGHVWIYTHHPFLQTEQLANEIARRAVSESELADVYGKVAAYRRERQSNTFPIATTVGTPAP